MASFTEGFWNVFIVAVTIGSLVALFLLIRYFSGGVRGGKKVESTGHVWDGDLQELNNPLPRWWLNLFYITLIFGFIYLMLYPGYGTNSMLLGWTQEKQYRQEVKAAEARYGPLYEKYAQQAIPALAENTDALKTGERLFATYCTQCHGSDARGVPGYPNLRDGEWLYGGDPQSIKTSILKGRQGNMPAWKGSLGEEGVRQVVQYVLSLSDRKVKESAAAKGQEIYATYCVACHGPQGKGNQDLGAPNLTDDVWLYGGSPRAVQASVANGRQGRMPAHEEFLGENKVHVLAAYVYSLSRGQQAMKAPDAEAGARVETARR
ncbi:MAG: cytochrome-c oxidase, cbb3-type subunit III [Gammaproteobacteria bacterium]|nr:cytochrome-c oxidase, cbb3-type subunit III [Gammaproteobacteria bacterium]NIR83518.1 cytochrome-c oxidase, cbb3-type subunit III [Gammaproteobacteria bacterium]NIR91440.1 cytochrome-c oxidase, cbb3-type subunit III [Gammaproteobacteria bacterium]NIU04680.1 cytochrome-c oxidase, cbb3-type subunit III [Gammaproteobacteria bacterium]NIV51722.1 cytochrome-c oxidase, cbb3-type subunit III [Gammaproteobacteria bacterium]